MELTYQRIQLGLFDYTSPARLHVDCDDTDGSAVLAQGEGESYRVVGMTGRSLSITERKTLRLERLLLVAGWALRKWSRYVLWVPITVMLPHSYEAACVQLDGLPLRL